MAKKYDTNPLDEDVLRRAEAARGAYPQSAETQENPQRPTAFFEADTRNFRAPQTVEMPTANFENNSGSYQSVFNNPISNAPVTTAVQYQIQPPTSRSISGLGVPENLAMILPYLPFTFGAIAGVVELLLVSRSETKVRFHAAQGLALHLAYLLISVILALVAELSSFANVGKRFFWIAATVFFIISMVRVWQGKPHHIEALDEITDFLNEKLKPRKQV